MRPAHPRSVRDTICLVTACESSCFSVGGLFQCSSRACRHSGRGRKALFEQVNHTWPCNGERSDNQLPGLTLLQRERPSRQYRGHHSGKLCPPKHARRAKDVTLKTCNPNENQIQSARSLANPCSSRPIAHLQLPYSR